MNRKKTQLHIECSLYEKNKTKGESPRKDGRDDLLSRVTALFLTVATLAFSKFVLNYPIPQLMHFELTK